MSDIPDEIMTAAMTLTGAMLRNYEQADYSAEVHIAARALMAAAREADEAATKRERERAAKCVRDCASALDFPSVYMGGPSRDAVRKANVLSDAILKGEA